MTRDVLACLLVVVGCECEPAKRCREHGMEPLIFHRTGTFCVERRPDGFGQVLVLPEKEEAPSP